MFVEYSWRTKRQRGPGLPPTDELDAACKRHDECHDAVQHRSCACDTALQREALALANTAGKVCGPYRRPSSSLLRSRLLPFTDELAVHLGHHTERGHS